MSTTRITGDFQFPAVSTSGWGTPYLLQELVYWFTVSSRELEDIFDKSSSERLLARSQALLVEHYGSRPEQLAIQLRGAPAPLLLWACYGLDRIRARRLGMPFDEWPMFAATILAALPLDPEAVAPQLSAFITRDNPEMQGPDQWLFDKEQCEILFGDPRLIVDRLRTALVSKKTDGRSEVVIHMRGPILAQSGLRQPNDAIGSHDERVHDTSRGDVRDDGGRPMGSDSIQPPTTIPGSDPDRG